MLLQGGRPGASRQPRLAALAADAYVYKLHGPGAPLNLGLTGQQRKALDALSLEQLEACITGRGDVACWGQ